MTITGAKSYPKGATMPHREEQRRKQAIARYLADDKIEDICKAMGGSKSWLYHIPPNLVVTPRASHNTLDLSIRYPHHVSSSPTAICMEMRHGTECQTDTPQPHHHRRFPR